jgi:hypothetical protein
LRAIAKEEYAEPQLVKKIKLFGGDLSVSCFNIWLARGQDTQETFGMSLLELPYWLYLDLVTLKKELAWHREDIKLTPKAGLPNWEDMTSRMN